MFQVIFQARETACLFGQPPRLPVQAGSASEFRVRQMIKKPVVHVLEDIHPEAFDRLAKSADVFGPEIAFPSACDALIVRAKKVTANDIAACPNLKVIGKHGAGLDAIDVDAAEERGITVLSTPGVNAESVADLAIGFALSLIRNIQAVSNLTKKGHPLPSALRNGWELGELPAGIFGLGAIGRATAHRLTAGFGAEVRAFDPGIPDEHWPEDIGRVDSLDDLLTSSRILFLHAPLLPSTRDAINDATLSAMPVGSYLVNCARGGIVDEAALSAALRHGQIAGAASDVFAQEPPAPDNPLFDCPNFLAAPHLGASTNGALRRVGFSIVEQVLEGLRDRHIPTTDANASPKQEK
ncbi:hydroxyacid dehydrogenase [Loktanella sp. SALINAS62]|uniref:hydroxyacid dehydrogenase n=1 Tax=Loktanella sp. SALINAS62 TaxID=2706124 RepID=UPI001B8CC972|nr:hydroxyacid dehydrogenase [Loktanella sp. SALINAS62]MBS1303374.1 hydroxyacid dehydrogenase [Loktanella sp. SALINAS62]